MKNHPCRESGNALWFVLLAVALLGILTAVISRTSSTVEQTGGVEQARIKATSILRFGQSIENAIQQMGMGGVSESDLDFVAISEDHDNPNCSDKSCEVFAAAGGALGYRMPEDVTGINNFTGKWIITSANRVKQFGCDDDDTSCMDLILTLTDVPDALCLEINKMQSIPNTDGKPPRLGGLVLKPYVGTFAETNNILIGGNDAAREAPDVKGKSAACVSDLASKKNVYYQVLIGR
jgi:hypothetical protein